MAARFMQWGFVILPKTMEMDEQTKKNIYKILEQAKVLEELMKEVELPSGTFSESSFNKTATCFIGFPSIAKSITLLIN